MSALIYVAENDGIETARLATWRNQTPPFSRAARIEAGFLLRRLQLGEMLGLPASRPMPEVGSRCHELRINDDNVYWRIVYYVADDAVVILEVFEKKSRATPRLVMETAKKRLRRYLQIASKDE